MSDSSKEPISRAAGIETRRTIDQQLVHESAGKGDTTVHGIPPFTVPRADGTLEASPDIQSNNGPRTATARMMRRRQNDVSKGDEDGDGNFTNRQGHRDGRNQNDPSGDHDGDDRSDTHGDGSSSSRHNTGRLAGFTSRRPFLQRIRKAFMPTLIGGLLGWWYDAVNVLIYRTDPRIKGTLLSFSLLCLSTMLGIFFYLEFIRPRVLKKPTVYVNWEKELLYPVRIATASLVMGIIGSFIALWPVWHFSTIFVLPALAVGIINVLGVFF